jgi:CRP/FNR family cyclic AMP-dependent transcriptional regulator
LSTFAHQLLKSLQFGTAPSLANLPQLTLTSYDEGDVITEKGCSVQAWRCVLSGFVAASIQLDKGKRLPITVFSRNAWFGEQALLSQQPSLHDHICLSAVEVIGMDKKCFDAALENEPNFVRWLLRHVALQSQQQSEMLTLMRMSSPPLRILMGLAQFAEAQCQHSTPAAEARVKPTRLFQTVDIPIGQYQLAELCGVSRTLFSQYIQPLARDGWLTLRYGGIALQSAATWRIMARRQRERQRVVSQPTIFSLLNDMAAAHEELGPSRFPNLINKRHFKSATEKRQNGRSAPACL